MSETSRVVVWDPKGEFWEGSLVPVRNEQMLSARGAALLPVEPTLFSRGGNAGYVRRAWGAGYPLNPGGIPRLHCPITMLVFRDFRFLHWKARLVSTPEYDERAKEAEFRPGGMVRFVGDSTRELTHHSHVTPVTPAIDVRDLGPKDAHGGWTVGGRVQINAGVDGHFGFAIYGAGEGLRVVWVAATQTKSDL